MSIHEDKIKDHDVFARGKSRKNHADRMLMVIVICEIESFISK